MIQTDTKRQKQTDLGERTKEFALDVRYFVTRLKKTIGTMEDCRQLIRSSGGVGANYIEANESLGKKDFLFRLRIARKEAKESSYWLELIGRSIDSEAQKTARALYEEAKELVNIFSAIISRSS